MAEMILRQVAFGCTLNRWVIGKVALAWRPGTGAVIGLEQVQSAAIVVARRYGVPWREGQCPAGDTILAIHSRMERTLEALETWIERPPGTRTLH